MQIGIFEMGRAINLPTLSLCRRNLGNVTTTGIQPKDAISTILAIFIIS